MENMEKLVRMGNDCLYEKGYFEKGVDVLTVVDLTSFFNKLETVANSDSVKDMLAEEWDKVMESIKNQGSMISSYLFGFLDTAFLNAEQVCNLIVDSSKAAVYGSASIYRMDVCKADTYLKASLYKVEVGE